VGQGGQPLGKVAVNASVANLVGMSQRIARNLPAEAHMIELGLLRAATSFDIARAFAISELSKAQAEELIPAREIIDVPIALISIDTELKLIGRKELQELRENASAKIHPRPPRGVGKPWNDAKSEVGN